MAAIDTTEIGLRSGMSAARTGLRRRARTPLPASGVVYASNVAVGGIPVGNDSTGTGTAANPFLTLDQAFSAVSSGGTVALNGHPSSPATYRHASFLNLNKSCSIQPVWPYGAIVKAATGTLTRVINCNLSGGAFTFGTIIVDAENSYQGCVTFADTAAAMTVAFNGTLLKNWTNQGAYSSGSATRLNVTYNGAIFQGGTCRSAIYHLGLAEGSVAINGGSIALTGQNTSSHGGAIVNATATGVTFRASGMNVNVGLLSSLTSAGTHFGIKTQNIANALIEDCYVAVTGAYGSRTGENIQITVTEATPLDSSGARIRRNTIYNDTTGGMGIEIGTDDQASQAANRVGGAIVEDNTVTGTANSNPTLHGIFSGNNANSIVRRNTVDNVGIGLVDKRGDGAVWQDNVITRVIGTYVLWKGAQNPTMTGNRITASAGFSGTLFRVSQEDVTAVNSSGGSASGNFLSNDGGASVDFLRVDTSQSVSLATNDYQQVNGTADANPWAYQGSNYATLAAWQAAREAGATGNM